MSILTVLYLTMFWFFLQFNAKKRTCINKYVFILHCRVTASLLFVFSVFITLSKDFRDSIYCTEGDAIPTDQAQTFCLIYSMINLPKINSEIPQAGANLTHFWMGIILALQAVFFYLPHHFWESYEGGRLGRLIQDLNCFNPNPNSRNESLKRLLRYFKEYRGEHSVYFGYFVACEVLNFVNVTGQMYLMRVMLGGVFFPYGLDMFHHTTQINQEGPVDSLVAAIPRVFKCPYSRVNFPGNTTQHNLTCLLPLNSDNEKITIILWFWFAFVAFVTGVHLFYRMMTIFCGPLRKTLFQWRARHSLDHSLHLSVILEDIPVGDCFLLTLFDENMTQENFLLFIEQLSGYIRKTAESKKETEKKAFWLNEQYI